MLIVLFIFFQSKIEFSRCICSEFFFWFSSTISLSKVRSLFLACENLSNLLRHFWKHKSVFLQILHYSSVSWNITPLYFLNSNMFYFVQKEPITVQIFETFECLGQNLSNSSCQFWNDKSIPLQILHHSCCHDA